MAPHASAFLFAGRPVVIMGDLNVCHTDLVGVHMQADTRVRSYLSQGLALSKTRLKRMHVQGLAL